MKKLIRLIVILVIMAGIAYFTCPDRNDFKDFVSERVEEHLEDQQGENESGLLNDLLNPVLVSGAAVIAAEGADEEKFGVANMYTVRYNKEDYKFLGLFGTFLPLQTKNILEEISN